MINIIKEKVNEKIDKSDDFEFIVLNTTDRTDRSEYHPHSHDGYLTPFKKRFGLK